jgi:pyruvate dehydrogenase E2 component (dihydrolipoamide acetyltransferase)
MDVIMPKMGESVSEGTIIKWHKKVGDKIKRDEIIFEISTDKVDTEIPSPADGFLEEIKVKEGDTVEVGTVVAVINENGGTSTSTSHKESEIKEAEMETSHKEVKTNQETAPPKAEKEEVNKETGSDGNIVEITMPKMGESVMEGTIIKWHKKVGEAVKKDETLFEISTDKVDTEVPSPEAGSVAEILVAEQETVEVGTVVAKLSLSGEVSSKKAEEKVEKKPVAKVEKEEPAYVHDNFSKPKGEEPLVKEGKLTGFYSPLVMNIARKENVSFDELGRINGTGLEGRITKKDILSYIENRSKKKVVPIKEEKIPARTESVASAAEVERIPMDNIRQKIMQHMVNSRDTSVHVSAMLEVDMTRIHNFIQQHRDEYLKQENVKLTYMAFIAHATVKALKEFPLVNAAIEGTTILKKKYINLGIAVAIEPTGLIVPNIKAADEKNIIGLARAINELAQKSRSKRLTPDDITGGTFTITNYGVFGTIFGTPIINQPEVAILGVGTVVKKPVVIEVDGSDSIAIRSSMALTLSHDHRLVDGMLGGRFLKYIKDTLESFEESNL